MGKLGALGRKIKKMMINKSKPKNQGQGLLPLKNTSAAMVAFSCHRRLRISVKIMEQINNILQNQINEDIICLFQQTLQVET